MVSSLVLSAALMLGQVDGAPRRPYLLPPAAGQPQTTSYIQPTVTPGAALGPVSSPGAPVMTVSHNGPAAAPSDACYAPCRSALADCNVVWLKPWKCEDLEMKPWEPTHTSCGLFRCVPIEKPENGNGKNGNGNGKNGNGNGADGNGKKVDGKEEARDPEAKDEKKNGNGEEEKKDEEEAPDLNPLMQAIKCRYPALFERLDCSGTKVYGWIQGGFTANFDSPRDRLNYAVNFNNRSNDVLLNQAYLVVEKTLDLDKKRDEFHVGYRLDTWYGHDAPYFENPALGFLDRFNGDRQELSRLSEMGLGVTQFYADIHMPVLTQRGVDLRVGRFYTYMTYELSPAPSTHFYSHTLEYFNMPYTHTGAVATVHVGDNLDIMSGMVRGWETVFQDNNDSWSYHGGAFWNSCDKRQSVALAWIVGPEQNQNNSNYRTAVTAYYTRNFGCYNEWMFVTGGGLGFEPQGTADPNSANRAAEWYSYSNYLFYTVNPKLKLGTRFEWYHDDDGNRTGMANSDFGGAQWNRPGFAGSFYNWTLGVTYKPYQNVRLRPELRFDWFDGAAADGSGVRPFNDRRDNFQTTLGVDLIWEF